MAITKICERRSNLRKEDETIQFTVAQLLLTVIGDTQLAAKVFANSLPLCKETIFSSVMEDLLVLRHQELRKEHLKLPLFDLKKLSASLHVPSVLKNSIQLLIMGASDNFIVDAEELYETANFCDLQPVCMEGVAHDVMLDSLWEKGAEIMLSWLKNLHNELL
ncbi:uncharacterized protein LOC103719564 [Phoenix dactylifera]|uniref:Uncharacterized protein LOC103719564 n=1 Tax=Phoenix dactylifera TaxID=42345 RepID=A0A8B7CUX0_PHODC|nr:uncharacterized protein LOC103719564 [Phoenix dactylifera]XP_008807091.1 uncharacterized protein LOC103719564 [Phoenix dactylifera]XP_038986065.1 uncharacterized protein LOC103719564 [Phoenix dactylifera]